MTSTLSTVLTALLLAGSEQEPAVRSAPDADRVEIVLFSDFQCPYCAQLAPVIREIQAKGIDGIKPDIQFKNFPLSIHPAAQLMHQAAIAAQQQGKFWEMHDLLFANPARVQRTDLLDYAKRLELELARFEKDLDGERTKALIAADVVEGAKLGVSGTPSYTINGTMYSGTKSLAQLTELIAGDRRRARALAEITDDLLAKGPANAPVTLELFADLQSPVTRPTLDVIEQVMQRRGSDVRLQFRNFPLAFHPQAGLAHEAAMAGAREGRFWEFARFMLDHQDRLREQDVITFANGLGLDPTTFTAALNEHRYRPRVDADLQLGSKRSIRGSPVIFVNGKRIDGVPSLEVLIAHVDAALKEP